MSFTRRKLAIAMAMALILVLAWISIESTPQNDFGIDTSTPKPHLKTSLSLSKDPHFTAASNETKPSISTQRIVFLAGPHETSSTSIQSNLKKAPNSSDLQNPRRTTWKCFGIFENGWFRSVDERHFFRIFFGSREVRHRTD